MSLLQALQKNSSWVRMLVCVCAIIIVTCYTFQVEQLKVTQKHREGESEPKHRGEN